MPPKRPIKKVKKKETRKFYPAKLKSKLISLFKKRKYLLVGPIIAFGIFLFFFVLHEDILT